MNYLGLSSQTGLLPPGTGTPGDVDCAVLSLVGGRISERADQSADDAWLLFLCPGAHTAGSNSINNIQVMATWQQVRIVGQYPQFGATTVVLGGRLPGNRRALQVVRIGGGVVWRGRFGVDVVDFDSGELILPGVQGPAPEHGDGVAVCIVQVEPVGETIEVQDEVVLAFGGFSAFEGVVSDRLEVLSNAFQDESGRDAWVLLAVGGAALAGIPVYLAHIAGWFDRLGTCIRCRK